MLDRIDIKYFKMAVGDSNIRETDNDIAVSCPVCGDSRTNRNSRRLHLYKKGDYTGVNCFNGDCPVENKTVFSFLRDFFPSHLSSYRREKFQDNMHQMSQMSQMGKPSSSGSSDVFDFGISSKTGVSGDFGDWENTEIAKLENSEISPVVAIDLKNYITPIVEIPQALEYIKSRGLSYSPELYGDWFYGHQNLEIDDVLYKVQDSVIIPLYTDSSFTKMYGFYSRSISEKFFSTFMQDINIGYKIWNYFNIDNTKEVYIFEGIFDAIASGLDNVIALMGAKLPEDRLREINNPVFVLDNDRTGLLNSIEYARKGCKVYIQNKYPQKDINSLMQDNPDLDVKAFIKNNLYKGILAEVNIKQKL